jgi:Helicase conserved C-terminal domain
MTDHKANRAELLAYLRYELVGPWEPWKDGEQPVRPSGSELDLAGEVRFDNKESAYGPFIQQDTGEEVLQRDRPCKRYGVGVLYPLGVPLEEDPDLEGGAGPAPEPGAAEDGTSIEPLTVAGEETIHRIAERKSHAEAEDDDFDLTGANEYRPSTMAVSFLAELPGDARLVVSVRGGRYHRKRVIVSGRERTWWLRTPVTLTATFGGSALLGGHNRLVTPQARDIAAANSQDLPIEVTVFTRPGTDGTSLLTVSLTNRSRPPASGGPDEVCLFQTRFRVQVEHGETLLPGILPYPARSRHEGTPADEEEDSFDLLYRKMKTFGVGHGCAADWDGPAAERVSEVRAEPLPAVETPSITPQIFVRDSDGARREVTVPMAPLAGLDPDNDGLEAVEKVIDLYEAWLSDEQRPAAESLDERYQPAARRHLADCERALTRMRRGLEFVRTGPARRAFQLANEAILLQQLRTRRTARVTVLDGARFRVPEPLLIPDWRQATDRGSWRPFQIAFLLCAVESVADPDHAERETVELIWFPTGGGKTEAYLGLAAFALFYRRLRDQQDHGVEVLMRYTLRLLTQQQFQRASSLACAMEHLRRRESDLGEAEFSIGMWLGGDSTPNRRDDARQVLRKLNQGDDWAENKFVILRCPWCSASMGPVEKANVKGKPPRGAPKVAGYVEDGGTVVFRCPDTMCEFSAGLPVYVIDEDIYEAHPSIVIATVDKFALLAWNDSCRALFGIGPDGSRVASPPQTIIQDELHLISGPLGSLVGLYEAAIEQLCTDERNGTLHRPKIISSTATIRRYEDQIKSLYAREDVALFPPRALSASDSFFARYATEHDGSLSAGRTYIGVHAPGLGSVQTAQVRTFSALLQGAQTFDDDGRDPWWTLMVFFNSLRELGTSLSLLQSDIPDYLKVIRNRFGLKPGEVRRLRTVLELTGRLGNDQVPKSMEQLSQSASGDAVDVCLASNVIEVGIDIDRLSLMAVVGQPKTTSQYIQVTGRIGRQWQSRPGVIATIYSATKPRDRSHFEKFRSYHERLYAQVEPTSVTPFSPPVLDRALHAVLVSFVRQNALASLPPWPVPYALIEKAYDLLAGRVRSVDKDEEATLDRVFEARRSEWQTWQRRIWQSWGAGEEIPLLRRAGEYATRAAAQLSWSTPTSLRNVDAECRAEVSLRYVQEGGNV